jgi:cell wall-associated NlpC family hydrolase
LKSPDPRLHIYRPDLAELALEGRVTAERYVEGTSAYIRLPVVPVRLAPSRIKARDTEYLFGEAVSVFDRSGGWAWVKSKRDGYVGYIDETALVYGAPPPTHRIDVLRSHLYPAPDLKKYSRTALLFSSHVKVIDTQDKWARIADGQWLYKSHLVRLDKKSKSPADVALRFLEVPYLWGGRSSEGMDCSALIQFALEACGIPCPRDTDLQEVQVGKPIDLNSPLKGGDLIFWPGHTGMMIDAQRILHCNATDMATRIWNYIELCNHIKRVEGHPVRTIKRLG